MEQTFQTLEFDRVRNILEEYACTKAAKEKIRGLVPYLEEGSLLHSLRETTQAREILDKFGMPPFTRMEGIDEILITACQGGCLQPEQLEEAGIMLTGVNRMKDFLNRCKVLEQGLPYYEENMQCLDSLREEIAVKIRGGRVDDFASPLLKGLRQEIVRVESKVREKADGILRNNKANCSDQFVTMRSGRLCLPVKKECRSRVPGSLIDKSSTGQTLFIEPQAVAQLMDELMSMKLEMENEERRILYELTDLIAGQEEAFRQNISVLEKLDFIFAKGRLSFDMGAVEPKINTNQRIRILNGRHPFIEKDKCVPLNFRIGDEVRGVIITGPNTGGKTVAIKTVGLLGIMAQCGLHVPCDEGDFTMNSRVLCDIGDGQNITANLSTFSAHITNILEILKKAGKESLVILDELGSGTDPAEGMGIAVAILEELRSSGCLYLVTTHYPEVKTYGEKADSVINARMAFDKESLSPLYKLEIGESGESCAFYIARHLGMSDSMLETAKLAAYGRAEQPDAAADAGGINEITSRKDRGLKRQTGPKIQKQKNISMQTSLLTLEYQIGDCVMVYPDKKLGIVCSGINDKGVLQVQLQKKKIWISHKRVKLHVKAEELYPEDYDFSIIFDTAANRKARHKMEKGYRPGLEAKYEAGEVQ